MFCIRTVCPSGDDSKEKELQRIYEHEEIIRHTLQNSADKGRRGRKYQKILQLQYARKRFFTAIYHKEWKLLKKRYLLLVRMSGNSSMTACFTSETVT